MTPARAAGVGVRLADADAWVERGGLIVPRRTRPVGIDLFCGAGGFSLGFLDAGWEVACAVDADPHAAMTYLANLGAYPMDLRFVQPSDREAMEKVLTAENRRLGKGAKVERVLTSGATGCAASHDWPPVRHFFLGDIRKIAGDDILKAIGMRRGEVDCVFGGPPCQGFSRAGRRNVMDPRNSLVFDFARVVLEIQPKTLVMENVPDIVTMVTPEGLPVIDALCRMLADGGMGTVEGLKRALAATSGTGAAFLGKPEVGFGRRNQRKPDPAPKADAQMSLLAGDGQ